MTKKTYLLIGAIIAIIAIGAGLYYFRPFTTPATTSDNNNVKIDNRFPNKIVYSTDLAADQEPLRQHCANLGGNFNDCGSPCGPDADVCITVCAFTCEFPSSDLPENDSVPENWPTWDQPDLGFTLRYPSVMTVDTSASSSVRFTLWGPTQTGGTEFYDGISLSISRFDLATSTLEDYVARQIENDLQVGEILEGPNPITMSGQTGLAYTSQGLGQFRNIFLVNGIHISYLSADPTNQGFGRMVEQILSTLRF